MSSVLVYVQKLWRDHIAGPTLRTYEQACEELGGVPWRPATETDRWFIGPRPDTLSQRLPSVDKLPTLDTGAINLKRSMSDSTKLLFFGGAAILAIALVVVLLSGGGAHAAPAMANVAAAPAVVAAPAPAIPSAAPATVATAPAKLPTAIAPTATAKAPSPSVQSLFSAHPRLVAKKHVVLARHRKK